VRYRLLCVGRLRDASMSGAVAEYAMRLRRYHPLEITEVPSADGQDPVRAKEEEGRRLLRRISGDEKVWLLERSGTQLSSVELAERLNALEHAGVSRLTIVVAGAYGASGDVFERAEFLWSLSRLTLLHEWARALAVEQLYRAAKIARGEPYHH
jgi:23S rRNA (pseudouridine1915-N3)-methyltransferase